MKDILQKYLMQIDKSVLVALIMVLPIITIYGYDKYTSHTSEIKARREFRDTIVGHIVKSNIELNNTLDAKFCDMQLSLSDSLSDMEESLNDNLTEIKHQINHNHKISLYNDRAIIEHSIGDKKLKKLMYEYILKEEDNNYDPASNNLYDPIIQKEDIYSLAPDTTLAFINVEMKKKS